MKKFEQGYAALYGLVRRLQAEKKNLETRKTLRL